MTLHRPTTLFLVAALLTLGVACGDDGGSQASNSGNGTQASENGQPETTGQGTPPTKAPTKNADRAATPGEVPESLPRGLLLSYAQFEVENGQATARPGPSRVALLTRQGGEWQMDSFDDADSIVMHKAMPYTPPGGDPAILTAGGMRAMVKLWRNVGGEYQSTTIWTEQFGETNSRMRDIEVGDIYGDGKPTIAVVTHDEGVVAMLRPQGGDAFEVVRLDERDETIVHEVELGDLNGDGTLEVYATPSEPNRVRHSGPQRGEVVRYTPATGEGRTVVANLGNRHAKEIYVDDVDGDGRDELYVAVEALVGGDNGSEILEPVEIRRYDHDTAPDAGVVIARVNDRLTRFLTAGDLDGDGKKELVVAAFRSGLWLLRPGSDPRSEWAIESIDRESSGFEHAAMIADLDEDGTGELYVAADEQGELRRYVWINHRPRRSVIHRRPVATSMMTWNIVPFTP